jgi:hypothetical protein
MAEAKLGARNGSWRGDAVGYDGAHHRVRIARGRASDHLCKCGAPAAEWANLTGNFSDLNDYEAKCDRCHRAYDIPGLLRKDNSSGVTGVRWDSKRRKWEVKIEMNGKARHVGLFSELALAVEARRNAEHEYFGDSAPKVGWFADQRRACRQARPF